MIAAIATIAIAYFTLTLKDATDRLWNAGERQLEHAQSEAAAADFNRKVQYDQIAEQIGFLQQSAEAADISARASRDLAWGTQDTARRELRAYVFNDHANLVGFGDNDPVIQVLIKNAGQTPAFNVEAWNAVRTGPFSLNYAPERPEDADVTRCNLGPGLSFHVGTRLSNFPDRLRQQIRAGSLVLYVFGRAEYLDAFGQQRFLQWRLYYDSECVSRPDGSLKVYPQGNEAN